MANRNVIREVASFFDRVKAEFRSRVDSDRAFPTHEKFTFADPELEEGRDVCSRDFIRRADVFSFESLGALGFLVGVVYLDEFYYYLVGGGGEDVCFGCEGVMEKPVVAGGLVLVFNFLDGAIPLRGGMMDLYDEVLYKDDEVDIKEVSLGSIMNFFPSITCFGVERDSVFYGKDENLSSKLGALFLSKSSRKYLSFRDGALVKIFDFSLGPNTSFPFDLLVGAMISSNWQHAFIEIYKIFEYLYPVPALGSFGENLRKAGVDTRGVGHLEMLGAIKDSFDWRPNEEGALKKVLSCLEEGASGEGMEVLCKIPGNSLHGKLYKLRNGLVHYKAGEELPWRGIGLSDSDWSQLVSWMIESAVFSYSHFFDVE